MPDTPIRRIHWPPSVSRPVATPLNMSVVYASPSPDALDDQYEGRSEGHTYSREGHPNARVLAERIAVLEGAPNPGWVTGSGMAALTAVVFALLRSGDRLVASSQLYGRSLRMLREELPRLGIETALADPTDGAAFARAVTPGTRMVLVETVSNPTLRIADLAAIAEAARAAGALLVVDNTFTTPATCQPFALGADIVLHSVTKLLAGHSDAMAGWVCAADAELQARIQVTAITLGLVPSPFDCWLSERGLHSFTLRQREAQRTAARLADAVAALPGVRQVLYPGRPDHPDHARAGALLSGPGNMLSFELEGGREAANRFVEAMEAIPFAPTLGDVATTISHPPTSSHRALSPEERAALGIGEGFFRISVGIEEPDALIAAFRDGIAAAAGGQP